jgi:DNA-binding beta-propeller fold protein YncE
LLTGLASAAPVVSDMNVNAINGTPLTAVAVSDDAQAVLVGLSDGTSGAIWLLSAQAQAKQLMPAAVPSAIRFLPQSQNAVLADSGWKQVALLTGVTTQFSSRLVADESQGVSAPADVDVTPDSNRIWVADAGASALLVIDIAAGAVASIDSPFAPSSLLRLAGRSVFLVAAPEGTSTGVWAPEAPNTGVWRLPGLSNFE